MKKLKLFFTVLCLLAIASSAYGSYSASGLIYYSDTGLGAPNPTAKIFYSQASNPCTTYNDGTYSGGWIQGNVSNGTKMYVSASKGSYYGSYSWTVAGNSETGKNVPLSLSIAIVPGLGFGTEPVVFVGAGPQADNFAGAFALPEAGTIETNHYSTTMSFEPTAMTCMSVTPLPPFTDGFYCDIDNMTGEILIEAGSIDGYVPLSQDMNEPTPLFAVAWDVEEFQEPTKTCVVVTSCEFTTPAGQVNPVPHVTEYAIGQAACGSPYFRLDTEQDWQEALSVGHIYPMESTEWEYYMNQWDDYTLEGESYPDTNFISPLMPDGNLYVYEGGGDGGTDPNDAGLVMRWGDDSTPDGNYAAAYKYDYLIDPDLSNCTITLMVTAPQFDMAGNQINQVSFGIQNPPAGTGPIRSWFWNCGPGQAVPWNTPTMLKIDTSKTGIASATPAAAGYMRNPGFDIKNVQWLIVDENGTWIGGGTPAPAPGGVSGLWNYWHWMMISPNTTINKGVYLKWSQPPIAVDVNDPPIILGWDEYSDYNDCNIVADDWLCQDSRPITDIHWWGSFIGWNQPEPPPQMPSAFHIGIWTDVPNPNELNPDEFSHPNTLVWENYCYDYKWNFAGYDHDPRQYPDGIPPDGTVIEPEDSCFQFNQFLSQDEWFYQETDEPNGTVYWLSIAPIWDEEPQFAWGWKTRPHYWNDDAVVMQPRPWNPPVIGATMWNTGIPIQFPPYPDPEGITFDMSFELTTNEPGTPSADLNNDGIVDFVDFAYLADQWLTAGP